MEMKRDWTLISSQKLGRAALMRTAGLLIGFAIPLLRPRSHGRQVMIGRLFYFQPATVHRSIQFNSFSILTRLSHYIPERTEMRIESAGVHSCLLDMIVSGFLIRNCPRNFTNSPDQAKQLGQIFVPRRKIETNIIILTPLKRSLI